MFHRKLISDLCQVEILIDSANINPGRAGLTVVTVGAGASHFFALQRTDTIAVPNFCRKLTIDNESLTSYNYLVFGLYGEGHF